MKVTKPRLVWLNFLGETTWRNWSLPWAVPWKRRWVEAWDEVGFLLAGPEDVYLSRVEPHPAWRDFRLRQWPAQTTQDQGLEPIRIQLNEGNLNFKLRVEDYDGVFVQASVDEAKVKPGIDPRLIDKLRSWNDKRSWPQWVKDQGFRTPEIWSLETCQTAPCPTGRIKMAWSSGGAGQVRWNSLEEFEVHRSVFIRSDAGDSQDSRTEVIPSEEWIAQKEIESPRRHWTLSFHLLDEFAPVAAVVDYDSEFHSVRHRLMGVEEAPDDLLRFMSVWRAALAKDQWHGGAGFDAVEDGQGVLWIVDLNARLDRVGLLAWIAERHGLRRSGGAGPNEFQLPQVSRWRGFLPLSAQVDVVSSFLRDFSAFDFNAKALIPNHLGSRILHFGFVEVQMGKAFVEIQAMHSPTLELGQWMQNWFQDWTKLNAR